MSKYIEVADTPYGKKHLINKDTICEIVETGRGCDFYMNHRCIETEMPYKWAVEQIKEQKNE